MARRVVVPTSDGVRVHVGHFGDAKVYLVFECRGGGAGLVGSVENPYRGEHHHHHGRHGEEGKRRGILGLMAGQGVEAVAMTAMGPGGVEFFESHGIRVVRVKPGTRVEEAASLLCG